MISRLEKLCYGIGTGGFSVGDGFVVGFLTLFCTDVLGLDPGVFALLLMIPRCCDIITDFLLMHYVEKTKTRFGTYRPWLMSAIPMGICVFFLFLNPSFLTTQTQKLIWVLIFYFLMLSIFETLYWCPYSALGGVISPDENDRSNLMAGRSAFESIFSLTVSVSVLPLLSYFGSGYRDATGWRYASAIYAVVGAAAALICFFGVRERVAVDSKRAESSLSLKEELMALKTSRPFLSLAAITMLFYLFAYAYYAIVSYHCIYNLGHEEWFTVFSAFAVVAGVAASLAAPKISEKIGRKKALLAGGVLIIVSAFLFALTSSFAVYLVFILLKSLGSMLLYVVAYASLPAVAEEIAETAGADSDGFVYGIFSSWGKLAIYFGGFLGTMLLSAGHYDATLEVQSVYTQGWIRYGLTGIMVLCGVLVILVVLSDRKTEA